MTNEDAVKREAVLNTLDAMDAALDENRTVEAYKELLKECYKALPPVTPKIMECEDCVSRQAVLDVVNNPLNIRLDKIIEGLPPVTPKPLDTVLDKIKAEIPKLVCCENEYRQALVKVADVIKCIDKYKGEST